MLPTFLVIGGMKCGTSALQQYLSKQGSIYLPPKNIDYFNDENWGKGINWYSSKFPHEKNDQRILGEISTEYTKHPHRCHAPSRIAEVLPEVKLIYLIRHPLKRAISHYIHNLSNLSEKRSLKTALKPDAQNQYLNFSLYYSQLEKYLKYFSQDNIKLVKSEDLLSDPDTTLKNMFEFIGAPEPSPVIPIKVHTREEKRKWNMFGRHIRISNKRYNLFNYYMHKFPDSVSNVITNLVSSPITVNELPPKLYDEIVTYITPDLRNLYKFAGDSFTPWDL